MGYICTRCGGTNVACEAIVNPNTGKIIDYFDGSFAHAICGDCENEVIISDIEEVKHEIDLGEFYQFNLSSCIRQQNSLTAQFVSFSLANLANIFYPPPIFTIINLCLL